MSLGTIANHKFNLHTIFAFLLFVGSFAGLGQTSWAQSPGVPVLPTTADDYVGYAVTDLPNYFQPGTPVGDTNNTPANNPITNDGAALGRALFYDDRLSHNDTTSCASCHHQENAFSDPDQFSVGFEGGLTGRHSMGLANAAFYSNGRFFWDERAATLEDQVLAPIQDPVELGTNLNQLRTELANTDFYPELFTRAFGDSTITNDRIARSLAQFVRSLASYQSKYDQARAAGPVGSPAYESVLTPQERLGSQIFHGGGRCSQCHGGDAQVGDRARNIGLDLDNSADLGVGGVTGNPSDEGKFKVPSLRNIAVRDGFTHDGRFTTLEEVIDFYSTDIQDNPNLDNRLRDLNGDPIQFNFTQAEKDALIAFLETLTDNTFLTSDLFSDPFQQLIGDFDDDGLVNSDDLDVWQNSDTPSGGDFLDWQRNLGLTWRDLTPNASLTAAANAVPEPSTTLLTLGALLTALGWRRPHT